MSGLCCRIAGLPVVRITACGSVPLHFHGIVAGPLRTCDKLIFGYFSVAIHVVLPEELPQSIGMDVRLELYKGLMEKVPLFQGLQDRIPAGGARVRVVLKGPRLGGTRATLESRARHLRLASLHLQPASTPLGRAPRVGSPSL